MLRWMRELDLASRFGLPLGQEPRGPAPDRSCGGCSVCCHAELVFEPPSKRGQDCPHLCPGTPSGGCTIHADRPRTCREFHCRWLEGWGAEEQRPDRCGLVFFSGNDECVRATEAWEGAAEQPAGREALDAWLAAGTDVGLFRYATEETYPEWLRPPSP